MMNHAFLLVSNAGWSTQHSFYYINPGRCGTSWESLLAISISVLTVDNADYGFNYPQNLAPIPVIKLCKSASDLCGHGVKFKRLGLPPEIKIYPDWQ